MGINITLLPVAVTPLAAVFSNSAIIPDEYDPLNLYTCLVITENTVDCYNSELATEEYVRKKIAELGGGSGGHGIPSGGKAGQYLCKQSDKDYDVVWCDLVIPEQYGLVTYDQDKTITIT